ADAYLSLDWAQARVTVGGREVQLTPLEFRLLSTFVRHPRQVLSREQLLELVWGDAFGVGGDQVKLYVGYLRRKLDPDAPDSAPICSSTSSPSSPGMPTSSTASVGLTSRASASASSPRLADTTS